MILKKKIQYCLLQNPSLIVIILLLLKCKTNKFTSGHVRKPSCRYGEIRIRITLYRSHVGISDVVPGVQQCASDESAVLQNLCSRDDPQIVPRYTHRAVARVRGGGLRRRDEDSRLSRCHRQPLYRHLQHHHGSLYTCHVSRSQNNNRR